MPEDDGPKPAIDACRPCGWGRSIMIATNSGLRTVTAETLAATNFARQYDASARVTRTAALKVAKLAAAAMGLKSAKIAMIDQLFACSKAVDWQNDGRPVVWPSNARLARSLGISVSTLKHHLNGLVRAGLIAYSDGPTYQRSGRRDADGNIVEADGIDLSPIAVRFIELSQMVDTAEYEAKEAQRLGYRRTVLRKEIQALIVAARREELLGAWEQFQARLDAAVDVRTSDNDERVLLIEELESLLSDVEQAYEAANEDVNFDAAVSKFRPLLTTAEPSDSESSNQEGPRANARESILNAACGGMALEEKPERSKAPRQEAKNPQNALSNDLQNISLDLVADGCPAYEDHAPGAFENWWSFKEAGYRVAAALNVNPQVWQEAIAVLGSDLAAAALAVTAQKVRTGLVSKPGAYLRTLVQRGRAGELHVSRSLFGLAQLAGQSGQNAPPVSQVMIFPDLGSIHFSPWAAVVRMHAPKPTPDVDLVANAFRRWARNKGVDLSGPDIERVVIGFCRKWRIN